MYSSHRNIDNMAISVLAYNRPKHLFVTLDSIFRMKGIERYPVSVILIYNGMNDLEQQLYYISKFPIKEIKILYEEPNCHYNHLAQFVYLNGLNYDWYLLIENDIILRPDSLDYLASIEKYAFVDCLYSNDKYLMKDISIYRSLTGNIFANLYSKYSLNILTQWLCSNMVMGHNIQGLNYPFYTNQDFVHFSSDCRLSIFGEFFKIIESVPADSRCLHFGLNSAIEEPARTELETQMFEGDKERWLENILLVLDRNKNKTEITKILRPSHFEYR